MSVEKRHKLNEINEEWIALNQQQQQKEGACGTAEGGGGNQGGCARRSEKPHR